MSEKLIPNRFLNLYLSFIRKGDNFTLFDIIQIMEEELEPTDRLFPQELYFNGFNDDVKFELKRFIYSWYEKDGVFELQYRKRISEAEKALPSYLKQLDLIRKNAINKSP